MTPPDADARAGRHRSALALETPSDAVFDRFRALVYEAAGIDLGPAKKPLLVARLGRRLRTLGMTSFEDYLGHVTGPDGASERVQLLDHIATNETRFFREPAQFDFLERIVLPAWRRDADLRLRPRRIRAWSAGCSTGEEPFSLAMTLLHHFPPGAGVSLDVLATDLSTRVLDRARIAEWPIERAGEIPEAYRRAYMLRGRGRRTGFMRAGPALRALVRFQHANLNEERWDAEPAFDLILCRNVLIYFDSASRARVIAHLVERLAPGGHLLLGHAESLRGVSERLRCVAPTIYRRPGLEETAP